MLSWVKKLTAAVAILLAVLLLTSCSGGPKKMEAPELMEPAGVVMDTATVIKGTICRTETYTGLVLPRVHELSFASSGTIQTVYVCTGSHVSKGDVLAQLDSSYYESALASQKDYLSYTDETAYISARQQQISIELAQIELETLRAEEADANTIRMKELAIEEMQSELNESTRIRAIDRAGTEESIASLETLLQNSYLIAPCDGTVVSCIAADGSYALENAAIMWLTEDADLYVSTDYIAEAKLSAADAVYATAAGERIEVAPQAMDRAQYLSASSRGNVKGMFEITNAHGAPLEAGMSAVVFVVSDTTKDALIVPSVAVHFDGGYFVYKVTDGAQVRQTVKLGVVNEAEIQILEGLEEGDVIYAGT